MGGIYEICFGTYFGDNFVDLSDLWSINGPQKNVMLFGRNRKVGAPELIFEINFLTENGKKMQFTKKIQTKNFEKNYRTFGFPKQP